MRTARKKMTGMLAVEKAPHQPRRLAARRRVSGAELRLFSRVWPRLASLAEERGGVAPATGLVRAATRLRTEGVEMVGLGMLVLEALRVREELRLLAADLTGCVLGLAGVVFLGRPGLLAFGRPGLLERRPRERERAGLLAFLVGLLFFLPGLLAFLEGLRPLEVLRPARERDRDLAGVFLLSCALTMSRASRRPEMGSQVSQLLSNPDQRIRYSFPPPRPIRELRISPTCDHSSSTTQTLTQHREAKTRQIRGVARLDYAKRRVKRRVGVLVRSIAAVIQARSVNKLRRKMGTDQGAEGRGFAPDNLLARRKDCKTSTSQAYRRKAYLNTS